MPKESTAVAIPDKRAWNAIQAAQTPTERLALAKWAVTPKEYPGFNLPVPPLFFDLPWAETGDAAVDDILAQIASAEDLTQLGVKRELRKIKDILNEPVSVLGLVAHEGQVEDARWGAYITLTVSVDGEEPEIIHTSSAQIVVTMWRLYVQGKLPAFGHFVEVTEAKKGRSAPLGFMYEPEL